MPNLEQTFPRTRFPASVFARAVEALWGALPTSDVTGTFLRARQGNRQWTYDTWDEFLGALGQDFDAATAYISAGKRGSLELSISPGGTTVGVGANTVAIAKTMAVFEQSADQYRLPEPEPSPAPPLRVFIGHGGKSNAWQDLKTHLHDVHHFDVVAYETGSRAGHTIRDVLETMLAQSSFALVVMTPEDEQADGTMRARQNVVHEAGLFQGRLGFQRTIIVLQEGVDRFSNIDGVQYIGFTTSIRETFGDVVAALYEASRGAR